MHSMDLIENYTALWIAVEYNCTVEAAFRVLDIVIDNKQIPKKVRTLNKKDEDDMIKFKDEMLLSYSEIGRIYGMSESGAYHRIKNRKKELMEG